MLLLFSAPTDASALRDTAPMYLTTATAARHLAAARVAGGIYDVDPDLLLSVAWHESRYVTDTITPERGGKMSCGAMTPEPIRDVAACRVATSSVLAGYIAGARHMRAWIDACHDNLHCALTGYAGGYYLIAECKRDPSPKACGTWDVFLTRAARIRDHRAHLRAGVS
jgi:soluble lytic murein transglycosylase-like protein